MGNGILLIDDDTTLLSLLRYRLCDRFPLSTATSGEEAVARIAAGERPEVVVCDMRMGGMDGVTTLAKIKELAPEAVRMMLTANTDATTAVAAINAGEIFRFFVKPPEIEVVAAGIDAARRQHQLIVAERELLESTLAGSVKVLLDILALASPAAFGRATRLRGWARTVASALDLPDRWKLDLAAMLAPIGLLSVPAEVVLKLKSGQGLSEAERRMVAAAPDAAYAIIAQIPRLTEIAAIVRLIRRGFDGSGDPADAPSGTDIPVEARILAILEALATLVSGPEPVAADFKRLAGDPRFDPILFEWMRAALEIASDPKRRSPWTRILPVAAIAPGMVLAGDVVMDDGRLFLAAETEISLAHVARLRNLVELGRLRDAIGVFARE